MLLEPTISLTILFYPYVWVLVRCEYLYHGGSGDYKINKESNILTLAWPRLIFWYFFPSSFIFYIVVIGELAEVN